MDEKKNEWFFCYWDEPEFNKQELKQVNNKNQKENGTENYTGRQENID